MRNKATNENRIAFSSWKIESVKKSLAYQYKCIDKSFLVEDWIKNFPAYENKKEYQRQPIPRIQSTGETKITIQMYDNHRSDINGRQIWVPIQTQAVSFEDLNDLSKNFTCH